MAMDTIQLTRPGLFVTGTDTGVGKTAVACGIAAVLRQQALGASVGVCKPFATGCRRERGTLVAEDAEALAHFADCRLPLETVCPIRHRLPMSPAAAAEAEGMPIDWGALASALLQLDQASDLMVIEGVGGLMVPLDPAMPRYTVRDLAMALGYPVIVVARSGLGTLNHTAMTIALLQHAGLNIAGIVMNGYEPDEAIAMSDDPSRPSNRNWLRRLTGVEVVATVPRIKEKDMRPHEGVMHDEVLASLAVVDWSRILRPPGQKAVGPVPRRRHLT
ncbi:MAG: dethiobiotin synthase [Planctomycetota bacterium]